MSRLGLAVGFENTGEGLFPRGEGFEAFVQSFGRADHQATLAA
jgi:hypothetical protein